MLCVLTEAAGPEDDKRRRVHSVRRRASAPRATAPRVSCRQRWDRGPARRRRRRRRRWRRRRWRWRRGRRWWWWRCRRRWCAFSAPHELLEDAPLRVEAVGRGVFGTVHLLDRSCARARSALQLNCGFLGHPRALPAWSTAADCHERGGRRLDRPCRAGAVAADDADCPRRGNLREHVERR